jgi:hypothetical protein
MTGYLTFFDTFTDSGRSKKKLKPYFSQSNIALNLKRPKLSSLAQ